MTTPQQHYPVSMLVSDAITNAPALSSDITNTRIRLHLPKATIKAGSLSEGDNLTPESEMTFQEAEEETERSDLEPESAERAEYVEAGNGEEDDDGIEEEADEDEDPDEDEDEDQDYDGDILSKKRLTAKKPSRPPLSNKKPPMSFPARVERSTSSDEDYAAKSHKKKFFPRTGRETSRNTPDVDSDGAAWKRGAARKVITYDEAQVDYGLQSEEEMLDPPSELLAGRSYRRPR